MKSLNAACLLLCQFLTFHLLAQVIYERTYPHAFPSVEHLVELSDTSTFSLGTNHDCGGIGTRHIDANGNENKNNRFWTEAFSSGYSWIGHDSILIWVEGGAYDVGPDSFRVYVWTPVETYRILSVDIRFQHAPERMYGAFLYSPGRIVSRMTDTLCSWDLIEGTIEVTKIIPGISYIVQLETAILVFSDHQPPMLLDAELEEIFKWENLTTLPIDPTQSVVIDSFLVGIEESNPLSLWMINVFTESVSQFDLAGYFDQVDDLQQNRNSLFVKGISNDEHLVLQLNQAFTIVDLKSLAFPELDKQFTFTYYPDRVYAWSYDAMANYKANYRMSYRYQNAEPIQYRDIELESMWVDSLFRYTQHYYILYVDAVIRNHSPDTIHSFTIHFEEIPIFFCDPGVYVETFDSQAIAPNELDTVSFQIIAYQTSSTFTRRFYLHHGNYHLDDQAGDNSFVLSHVISSIDDQSRPDFALFPNPVHDNLYLLCASCQGSQYQLQIFASDGSGISFTQLISNIDGQLNLPVSHLQAGTYHLIIRSMDSGKMETHSFVRQ